MTSLFATAVLPDLRLLMLLLGSGGLLIIVALVQRRFRIAGGVFVFLCLAGACVWQLQQGQVELPEPGGALATDLFDEEVAQRIPRTVTDNDYVSSQACQECHPKQHQSWHDSYHRTMTQLASPESVVAPFDDVQLGSATWGCFLEREGDEYWANMVHPMWVRGMLANDQDPTQVENPPRFRSRVVMTTGSHRRQSYWVLADPRHEGNEVFQLPWTYQIDEKRWVPLREAFLGPAKPWVIFSSWNESCIHCHSVAGRPGMRPPSEKMDSEVAEFGIACEACHGPGGEHVRRQRAAGATTSEPLAILNPAKGDHRLSAQVCGQCHSVSEEGPKSWWTDGRQFRPGTELSDVQHVVRYKETVDAPGDSSLHEMRHAFWKDGTARTGGREFNGLLESACFQRGKLSCISCHSMHDSDPEQQVAAGMRGNDACLQCHSEMRERLEQHTHHAPSSAGSQCYNCHMPHTSYALYRVIRSHRIDSPSVATSVSTGRPNACNLCHLDKTLGWTQDRLADWYNIEPVELTQDQQEVAASLLWALTGDAAQRVVAAGSLGSSTAHQPSGDSWQAPFLAVLLEDPYAAVRWVADRGLHPLPGYTDLQYDFVGSEQNRAEVRQKAQQIWAGQKSQRNEPELLLLPDGSLDAKSVSRLLKKRNEERVYITE